MPGDYGMVRIRYQLYSEDKINWIGIEAKDIERQDLCM